MAGRIKQSDVSDQDVYGLITASAEKLQQQLKETNADLVKQAKSVKKLGAEYDKLSQKGIDTVIKKKKTLETLTKKAINLDKIEVKNSKALHKARMDEMRGQKRLNAAVDSYNRKRDIGIKQSQRAKKATLDGANAYKVLSKNVNSASARLKRMAAQYGVTDKRTIRAQRNFDRLEKKLRGVNAAARDGRRDVGRYGLALKNVRGSALRMAAGLGLVGGGLAIFRNAFNTVKDFEQGQADLASVLGVNVDQMKDLTAQARELGGATTFTAAEVSSLQKELAKLGFDQGEIKSMTAATLSLAEATGTDLAESATVTGSTLRAFGLSAQDTQKVVDVMAKSFSSSSLDMQKFKVAMATVAPVAKAMGLSIEETTALIGTLTDNGVEASTAGAGLRNMMLDAKKAGLTLDEALEKINNSSDKVGASFNLFGKRGATLGVVLAANRDQTDKLTDSLEDAEGAADAMAKTQRDTLGGALKELSSAWSEYILGANEAGGASDKLKGFIQGLTKNLTTVLSVIGKVIKLYALYRAALIALKLQKHIKDILAHSKSLNKTESSTKKLSKSTAKFKGALSAVGWAAAIAAITSYVSALASAINGTDRLKRSTDALNAAIDQADKFANERSEKRLANYNRQLAEIKALGLSEEEFAKRRKKLALDTRIDIEKDIEQVEKRRRKSQIDLAVAKATLNKFDGAMIKSAEAARNLGGNTFLTGAQKDILAFVDSVGQLEAKVAAADSKIDIYRGSIGDLTTANAAYTAQEIEGIKETEGSNSAQEKKLSLLRQIEDEQIKQIANAHELATIQASTDANRNIEDIDLNTNAQERSDLIIEIERNLLLELTRIDKEFEDARLEALKEAEERERLAREAAAAKRIEDFKKYQADLLKAKKLELLKSDKDEKEIKKEFLEFEIAQLQLRTQLTLDEEIELQKKLRELKGLDAKGEDNSVDHKKEILDKLDDLAQKALDKEIERSKKKQSLLDEEIDKSQELEDRLREGAANQNAVATESLAAQSDITEQKQREKLREAKREERLEELKALWAAFNSFINQGDNPLAAGGKAAGAVGAIKKLFSNLTGFAKGTKGRLGAEHTAQASGVDGHVVRVDSSEAILTGKKMDRLAAAGLTTTDDIVNSAIMNQQLVGVPMANAIDDRVVGSSNVVMEGKLDAILAATKNNKPSKLHPVIKQGMLNAFVEQEYKNGKVIRNWTRR